jgi:hypothetical protein
MSDHRGSKCYIVCIRTKDHVVVIIVWVPSCPPQNIGEGFSSFKKLCWGWAEREGV